MKLMFIADIHGSAKYLEKALSRFREEKPERLVILGDILYHGPRNPIPDGYDPEKVIELLNPLKDRLLAVRGNCDSEVDQMVLDFPMSGDYLQLMIEDKEFYLSHGHLYNNELPQTIKEGSIYVQGHTHVPMVKLIKGCWHINPGSVTLPKEGHKRTYGTYENNSFSIKTIDGDEYMNSML